MSLSALVLDGLNGLLIGRDEILKQKSEEELVGYLFRIAVGQQDGAPVYVIAKIAGVQNSPYAIMFRKAGSTRATRLRDDYVRFISNSPGTQKEWDEYLKREGVGAEEFLSTSRDPARTEGSDSRIRTGTIMPGRSDQPLQRTNTSAPGMGEQDKGSAETPKEPQPTQSRDSREIENAMMGTHVPAEGSSGNNSREEGTSPSPLAMTNVATPESPLDGLEYADLNGFPVIKCGPIKSIITTLYMEVDQGGPVPKRVHNFLLTYRTYLTPPELLADIVGRFDLIPETDKNKRIRIFSFVKKWVSEFWNDDFTDNPQLQADLDKFAATLPGSMSGNLQKEIRQKKEPEERPDNEWRRGPPPKSLSFKISHGVDTIPAKELARQLCLYDLQNFRIIPSHEFVGLSWQQKNKEELAPRLLNFIDRTNVLGAWVVSCIVSEEKLNKRSKLVKYFVQLARECLLLQNYNAVFAIIQGGLRNSSIHRLKMTWQKTGKAGEMTDLMEFLSSDGKYKAYRKQFKKSTPPMIPYLGVFLTDLTMIEETNPDRLNEDDVNLLKCAMLGETISSIYDTQHTPFNFTEISSIQEYIDKMGANSLTDSEAWAKSQEAEPPKN